ncbi:hypothetical protein Vau01_118330 [Virgisporangium aurantiacum]|uniref:Uncharacterized protein n=1 Tax=Virgisporangium aurantiacum TaxID=175570 RepID=A0A8J4EA21_9ACTN|nr:hypothetical protein Vau01_118330 [Virgisporangium aurantiacum]
MRTEGGPDGTDTVIGSGRRMAVSTTPMEKGGDKVATIEIRTLDRIETTVVYHP